MMPSVGNIAYRMTVKGHDVLRWPHASLDAFKASPNATGIPFMGPWINRLDEQAFYANGTRYAFDMSLGNVRGAIPIHGFLTTTDRWQLTSSGADRDSAWATSRLEFYRQPAWMKQWPFAHTIEMTYRLRDGVLEVATSIVNLSAEPMPVTVGFHPYFQLTDSRRDDWTISVGARTRWKLLPNKVPSGETEPIERFFPNPASVGAARPRPRRRLQRSRARRTRPRHDDAARQGAASGRRVRTELPGRSRMGAQADAGRAGTEFHLLRADGRHDQRHQPGAPGTLQGTAVDSAWRHLAPRASGSARAAFERKESSCAPCSSQFC